MAFTSRIQKMLSKITKLNSHVPHLYLEICAHVQSDLYVW